MFDQVAMCLLWMWSICIGFINDYLHRKVSWYDSNHYKIGTTFVCNLCHVSYHFLKSEKVLNTESDLELRRLDGNRNLTILMFSIGIKYRLLLGKLGQVLPDFRVSNKNQVQTITWCVIEWYNFNSEVVFSLQNYIKSDPFNSNGLRINSFITAAFVAQVLGTFSIWNQTGCFLLIAVLISQETKSSWLLLLRTLIRGSLS